MLTACQDFDPRPAALFSNFSFMCPPLGDPIARVTTQAGYGRTLE